MTDFVYTDATHITNSSVIGSIYYNSDDKQMLVELNDATLCGYEDVPKNVYNAFAMQEELGASAGRYWNEWIKPYFSGFSTSEITDIIAEEDVKDFPKLHDLVQKVTDLFKIEDNTRAEELIAQAPVATEPVKALNEYLVAFDYTGPNGVETEGEIALFATGHDEAIANFNRITSLAGYVSVKPTSVTLYFA